MPITWHEDAKHRWAVLVYSDPYTTSEWNLAIQGILEHPIAASRRLLVDRRDSTAPTSDFVRHLISFGERHGSQAVGARIALVASHSAGYGMARMTEILSEVKNLPITVRSFREYKDAEAWLAEPIEPA